MLTLALTLALAQTTPPPLMPAYLPSQLELSKPADAAPSRRTNATVGLSLLISGDRKSVV